MVYIYTLMPDAESVGVLVVGAVLAAELSAISWTQEAVALLILCTGCAAASRSTAPRTGCLRPDASDGLALGCCTPTLLIGALTLVRVRAGSVIGPLRKLLWAAIACAAQAVLSLQFGGWPLAKGSNPGCTIMLGFALGGVLFTLDVISSGSFATVAGILLLHTASLGGALRLAPGSFTFGEAAALAQGLALLLVDAAILTACSSATVAVPWPLGGRGRADVSIHPGTSWCAPRPATAIVCEALLSGGLALSAVLALALTLLPRWMPAHARSAVFVGLAAAALATVLLPWLGFLLGAEPLAWLWEQAVRPGRPSLVAS